MLILLPTFNEVENIDECLTRLFNTSLLFEVLVIDDGSIDGTIEKVKAMQRTNSKIHLMERSKKEGLGRAYLAGMEWGLKKSFKFLLQMDADLSHRAQDILAMREAIESNDAVIGSRYIPGGKIENWSFSRRRISQFGNLYANFFLRTPLHDLTGGFNLWRREVLEKLPLSEIKSEGYGFQIELKYRAYLSGFRINEVPITFVERENGRSKMSQQIVWEAMRKVPALRRLSGEKL